ncbi:MAG: hypothetical protein FWC16_05715 [Defluviitaleaceae bacterium]|nr:hypothetical protein [Defluviitaleaceae bacterium]MCL2274406.1 hypothetical protein [Defluviitaleaceae bacterium]
MFQKIGQFFKRVFGKRAGTQAADYEASSRFKQFYEVMDKTDPVYPAVRHAATLCDDALRVAGQRMRISAQLHEVNEKLMELDAFVMLSDEEVEYLKKMLERFMNLSTERSVMLERLSNYDSSLVDMTPLEEDARTVMPTIKDAEKLQRTLRSDIGYLMGEKEELIHEREEMGRSLQFIHRFTMVAIGLFVLVGAVLAVQFFVGYQEVFWPVVILVLLVMGIMALLYAFRFRLRREMRLNLRKQHRAVELLNKKNVVYAYYTNFLKFCYDKYKAKNSRTLENNLNDLESYRHLTNRIDTVRSLLYETEEGIDTFLRAKRLTGIKATIEGFAETVNLDDKRRRIQQLEGQKNIAERDLAELDRRHEEIWEVLMALNDADLSQRVGSVVETYLAEAGKLFPAAG